MDDGRLDALLAGWATAPAGDRAAHARIIERAGAAIDAEAGGRRTLRWFGVGGIGLAASVAAALLLTARPAPQPAAQPAPTNPDAAFAALYTPTPVEEQLL